MTESAPVKLCPEVSDLLPKADIEHLLDADSSRPRGRDETEHPRVRIKPFGNVLSVFDLRCPIQSQVDVPVKIQEQLQYVEDLRHLRED